MKFEKSLEEVWKWKDKIYQEIKNLSPDALRKRNANLFEEVQKKYHLKVHTMTRAM